MIKGIFFDFDGVITQEKQGTPPTIAYIAKTTGLPTETVEKAYRRHNRALLMGEVTHPEMWQPFCEELFDVVVISAQVHCWKTDERIFEEALKRSGLEPQECVFIDNSAQNLEVPGKMGLRTVYFDDEKRDLAELREILKEKK